MSDTNVFFSAVQSALDAHIKRMVEEATAGLVEHIAGLSQRIDALETKLTEAKLFEQTTHVQTLMSPEMIVESMNNAEWLWEKINAYIETGIEDRIERAIDNHCSNYDHDDYDRHISDDDIHFEGDLDDAVREAVGNLSFDISVS